MILKLTTINYPLLDPETEGQQGSTGYRGTPPVADIDDTSGEENSHADDFASIAADLLGDDDYDDSEVMEHEEGDVETQQEVGEKEEEQVTEQIQPEPEPEPKKEPEPEPIKEEAKEEPEPQKQEEPETTPPVDYETARKAAIEDIQSKITFTDEQIEQLHDEPEKALSRLAAELYVDVHEAILSRVYAMLPQMLQNVKTQETASREAEQRFFQTWPKLNATDPTHRAAIERIGKVYRQMNPKATAEDFTRDVGAQVMVALKMPLSAEMDLHDPAKQQQQPLEPYRPAKTGGNAPTPVQSRSDNVFEQLADEIIADDNS